MTPERWLQVDRLFHEVLAREPSARPELLAVACAGDDELRHEVESLLAQEAPAEDFLKSPALHAAAHALAPAGAVPAPTLAAGARLGPYEVISLIGTGGMGEVYKARDIRLERSVAIKILPPEFSADPDRRARFEREAKAIAGLSHPHICPLFDVGDLAASAGAGRAMYLVMEYLAGETLAARLQKGPLPVAQALTIGTEIAEALAAAHGQGVIHRDLKPGNVMLTTSGAKLLDFGLAKLKGHGDGAAAAPVASATSSLPLTAEGTIVGTLQYMAPEQVEGQPTDAPADIFAFGCVLYEMLTGRRAFAGHTAASIIAAIMSSDPPAVSVLQPVAPPGLDRLVRRCLAKDPDARWQHAADVVQELRGISAASASSRARVGRPTRHPRRQAAVRAAAPEPAGAPLPTVKCIVVLPFTSLAKGQDQEYFADGLREELAGALSQVGAVGVISRTSSLRYRNTTKTLPQIARELNVDGALEGLVQYAGNEVRVTVNLFDARSDRQMWGNSYLRHMADVLNLQNEIALAVASEIKVALSPAERQRLTRSRSLDPEAYQFWLRGNHQLSQMNEEGFRNALQLYRQALDQDPQYAPAYVGMAQAYLQMAGWFSSRPPREYVGQVARAIEQAVVLDPTLADAHIVLGSTRALHDWNWAGADEEFQRGVKLNPTSTLTRLLYANYLSWMGRFEKSIAFGRRTIELDPFEPTAYNELAFSYWVSRCSHEAKPVIEKSLELNSDHPQSLGVAAGIYTDVDPGRARGIVSRLVEMQLPVYRCTVAALLVRLGERDQAARLVRQAAEESVREYVPPSMLAVGYGALGDKDGALALLEQGFEQRDIALIALKTNPYLDPIRSEPRFRALLLKMNFPG